MKFSTVHKIVSGEVESTFPLATDEFKYIATDFILDRFYRDCRVKNNRLLTDLIVRYLIDSKNFLIAVVNYRIQERKCWKYKGDTK